MNTILVSLITTGALASAGLAGQTSLESPPPVLIKTAQTVQAEDSPQTNSGAAGLAFDPARAAALLSEIENLTRESHEAIASTNLPAAQTALRRLLASLTNFNAVVQGTDCELPAAMLKETARVKWALDAGAWDQARELAQPNEPYRDRFKSTAQKIADSARQPPDGRGRKAAAERPAPNTPVENAGSSSPAGTSNDARLNADQQAVVAWTDRQFRGFLDNRNYQDLTEKERADLTARLLETLRGPESREYYQAINTLGTLRSQPAVQPLLQIAVDRAEKNCRDRWMATRALGLIGDKSVVPELAHLVYHGNANTRWWAQISLVRLTGQNFGNDWQAWGKWWQQQGAQPPFKPDVVRWYKTQADPDKLAESLADRDRKFLEGVSK